MGQQNSGAETGAETPMERVDVVTFQADFGDPPPEQDSLI
jgi:hypothetical protein